MQASPVRVVDILAECDFEAFLIKPYSMRLGLSEGVTNADELSARKLALEVACEQRSFAAHTGSFLEPSKRAPRQYLCDDIPAKHLLTVHRPCVI